MSYRATFFRQKSPYLARYTAWLVLCLIATVGPVAHAQDESRLTLRDVQVTPDAAVYELNAKIDLTLPDGARKAVESGLTLRLTYEITVDRVRRYMPDAGIAALEQRYEVSYHALSQRYLVKNLNTGEQQDFGSLQAALDRVGELHGLWLLSVCGASCLFSFTNIVL